MLGISHDFTEFCGNGQEGQRWTHEFLAHFLLSRPLCPGFSQNDLKLEWVENQHFEMNLASVSPSLPFFHHSISLLAGTILPPFFRHSPYFHSCLLPGARADNPQSPHTFTVPEPPKNLQLLYKKEGSQQASFYKATLFSFSFTGSSSPPEPTQENPGT